MKSSALRNQVRILEKRLQEIEAGQKQNSVQTAILIKQVETLWNRQESLVDKVSQVNAFLMANKFPKMDSNFIQETASMKQLIQDFTEKHQELDPDIKAVSDQLNQAFAKFKMP